MWPRSGAADCSARLRPFPTTSTNSPQCLDPRTTLAAAVACADATATRSTRRTRFTEDPERPTEEIHTGDVGVGPTLKLQPCIRKAHAPDHRLTDRLRGGPLPLYLAAATMPLKAEGCQKADQPRDRQEPHDNLPHCCCLLRR